MKPEFLTLSNGLRIATTRLRDVETATVSLWVNAGARCETEKENGISHFLEHMLFKGTKRRTAQQIAEEMDAVGGYMNAYTSREHTVYYTKVLKDSTPLALDILGDMLLHSVMAEEEVKREQGVVLQEIGQSLDTPDDIVFDYHQETAFPGQPLGRPVLGTENVIKSLTRERLFSFIAAHYGPENIVLAAAGNIDHHQIAELGSAIFGEYKGKKQKAKERGRYRGGDRRIARDLEQLHFILGFEGVSYTGDDIYPMQLLATVLGGGMSSRLFQEIREKRGLAYTVQALASPYAECGLFSVYAGTSEDKAEELVSVMCGELMAMTHSVSETELARAKTQLKSGLLMEQESTSARAEELGRHLTCYGRHIPPAEIIGKIETVEPEAITRLARRIFTSPPTVTALGATGQVPEYEAIQAKLG